MFAQSCLIQPLVNDVLKLGEIEKPMSSFSDTCFLSSEDAGCIFKMLYIKYIAAILTLITILFRSITVGTSALNESIRQKNLSRFVVELFSFLLFQIALIINSLDSTVSSLLRLIISVGL